MTSLTIRTARSDVSTWRSPIACSALVTADIFRRMRNILSIVTRGDRERRLTDHLLTNAGYARRNQLFLVTVLGVMGLFSTPALAQKVIFTIDPTQSVEIWSGTDNLYGAFQDQTPGSLKSQVGGHFLVEFDPLTSTPSSIQFDGGHGYFKVESKHSTGTPGVGLSSTPAPANFVGQTAGGEVKFAIRDLVWDFATPAPIAVSSGSFSATSTPYTVTSGSIDLVNPLGSGTVDYTYAIPQTPTTGAWTISESAPGSGDWSLSLNGTRTFVYPAGGLGPNFGTMTASATLLSTAHFGASNMATIPAGPAQAQLLGGSGAIGGVTVDLNSIGPGGSLSVQQIPNDSSLSQAAVIAAQANSAFALSTQALSLTPQIWNVEYTGSLFGTATLVFHYDPALLPPGLNQLTLGIWHFNSASGYWEFGGTVNPLEHTITYETSSFSPFELGVAAVPEPSALVLFGTAFLAFGAYRARKQFDRNT